MEKLIVLVASTLLGGVGWWLGDFFGLFAAFMLSIVGTALGVYLGRRFSQEYLP